MCNKQNDSILQLCYYTIIIAEEKELVVGWYKNDEMSVQVAGKMTTLSLTGGYEMSDLVAGWRKNCITLKAGSSIKVHKRN